MYRDDREFLIEFAHLNESDIATLEEISYDLLGEGLDIKEKMWVIWRDVTSKSNENEKQKDWKEMGSDTVLEEWANKIEDELYQAADEMLVQDKELFEKLDQVEQILNTVRKI